ncbi:hypothetical protein [uncultured Mitsuokella sp.]|uniref:hypothetical protein n=1 Tax=uncultured Mitsuokella sp. TaxID=453120 RepID=UPI002608B4C5|nr:hypothetical protein [uncultured Mitsuokella sp.]
MFGWERLFRSDSAEVIGIACREAELCYIWLSARSDSLRIEALGKEPCTVHEVADIAEQVRVHLAKRGLEHLPIAVGLAGEDAFLYPLDLPQGMAGTECMEAAAWEMDAWLSERGYDAESFRIEPRVEGPDSACTVAAVQKKRLEAWAKACEAAALSLCSISVLAPEGRGIAASSDGLRVGEDVVVLAHDADAKSAARMGTALAAALAAVGAGSALAIRVWGEAISRSAWRVGRISRLIVGVTLTLLLGIAAVDGWQLYEAKQEAAAQEAQLAAVAHDRKAMQLLTEKQNSLQRKDAMLADLTDRSFPWYSVLVHLGTPAMCLDGVWLDGMVLRDERTLELQGNAVSYDALSAYVMAFERDLDFFPNGAVLTESGVTDRKNKAAQDIIHFRLTLKL